MSDRIEDTLKTMLVDRMILKADPADIDETKRLIDAFAPGGGFVFSTVHNVQDDVPIENFMAMWEAFQDNCKY